MPDMYVPLQSCVTISLNQHRNMSNSPLHSNVDVLVIGAGPTGLGAAKRLNQIVSFPYHTASCAQLISNSRMAHRG